MREEIKCCKDYNGTLDITNSCIFCKTYFPKVANKDMNNNMTPIPQSKIEDVIAGIIEE